MENLNALTLTALAATLTKAAKARRNELTTGTHEIAETVTLEVNGEVRVLEGETYTPTADIPIKVALALFCRYAGVTGPAAMDALTRAMTEALAIDGLKGKAKKNAYAAIGELANLDAAEKRVRAGLDALPTKSRNGKVSASVEVVVAEAQIIERKAA